MNYYLFRLEFKTPVHFGDSISAISLANSEMTFCADRLFSAICQILAKKDASLLDEMVQEVEAGNLKFSDAFPYRGNDLYLPRPCLKPKTNRDSDPKDRKKMKKVKYIKVSQFKDFIDSINGKKDLVADEYSQKFGQEFSVQKVAINRTNSPKEYSKPYTVGTFQFENKNKLNKESKNCGLYFLVETDNKWFKEIKSIVSLLGDIGIGGRVSSGYGKFKIKFCDSLDCFDKQQTNILKRLLTKKDSDCYITLTTSFPNETENLDAIVGDMDDSLYTIVRRGGFIADNTDGDAKKKTQYFFASGSTFSKKYDGAVFKVGEACGHPVYRYSVPIFMGV